jgi:hypothetical protein
MRAGLQVLHNYFQLLANMYSPKTCSPQGRDKTIKGHLEFQGRSSLGGHGKKTEYIDGQKERKKWRKRRKRRGGRGRGEGGGGRKDGGNKI